MTSIKIFGYGSLLNKQSLLNTSPDAIDIRPAYIQGFRRSFNLLDKKGLTAKYHGSLRGQPFCALDVEKSTRDSVNGLVFTVRESLKNLKAREHMYQLVKTPAFNFADNTAIGQVLVFSAGRNDASYSFKSAAQARYLDMCLAGAKAWGIEFYEQFLATTFIGDQTLLGFPKLIRDGGDNYQDLTLTS